MSYIRNISNPEGLYIFSSGKEVEVQQGPVLVGKLPTNVMNGLIKKYVKKNQPDKCKHKGAKVEEVWVRVSKEGVFLGEKKDNDLSENEVMSGEWTVRTKLSYDSWHVYMYDVTWYYIAYSNVKRK